MKITLYTISDCQFSQQEKNYLLSKNLPYEEKNLESNREFLTEMLTLSNNFAGTPVTKIEKDDGQIIVLKGFTVEEFDKAFGFQSAAAPMPVQAPIQQPLPQVVAPQIQQPVVEPVAASIPQPVMPPPVPVMPIAAPSIIPQVESVQPTAIPQQPVQQYVAPVDTTIAQPQQYVPQPVQMDQAPVIPAFNTEPSVMQPPMNQQPVQPTVDMQIPQPQYIPPVVEPMNPVVNQPTPDQGLNDILSSLQSKVEDNPVTPQAPTDYPPINNTSPMN